MKGGTFPLHKNVVTFCLWRWWRPRWPIKWPWCSTAVFRWWHDMVCQRTTKGAYNKLNASSVATNARQLCIGQSSTTQVVKFTPAVQLYAQQGPIHTLFHAATGFQLQILTDTLELAFAKYMPPMPDASSANYNMPPTTSLLQIRLGMTLRITPPEYIITSKSSFRSSDALIFLNYQWISS